MKESFVNQITVCRPATILKESDTFFNEKLKKCVTYINFQNAQTGD